jgi:hypothetical protein
VATVEGLVSAVRQLTAGRGGIDPHSLARQIERHPDTVVKLEAALRNFVDEANFVGRDVVAEAIFDVIGIGGLEAVIRAAAEDLGDDQDSLQALILDRIEADPTAARNLLESIDDAGDAALQETVVWAIEYCDEFA